MNAYERHIFNGSCPYTDKPCDKDIDCSECEINHEEKTLFDHGVEFKKIAQEHWDAITAPLNGDGE